ncbi:MAG TPA: iron-sulfur cluster repair di-iron protein [Candidatus Acidoferrales bacterium]
MEFSGEMKLKDIALSNPAARQTLEDAGLDYCCSGTKSLYEACLQGAVSAEEILKRLGETSKNVGPDNVDWMTTPLSELTRHIREKHHHYVRESLPQVQAMLEKVVARHGQNHPEIAHIRGIFVEVGNEMLTHMRKEEQVLFPYIDAVDAAANAHAAVEPPFFRTVKNPIHTMMKEHDAAGELVKQIRSLSGSYTPPMGACTTFRALYQSLKEFDADLHQHVHLENNVLFPRAVEAEATVA